MSLFDDDKKGKEIDKQNKANNETDSILIADENQSELMTYQPSPYNNNLDLNELLQNVDDV